MNPRAWPLLLAALACGASSAVPNPVLPGTADCGVLRFGGEYYLMGVGTNGGVYVSRDLVAWQGPFPVFSMRNDWAVGEAGADHQIHACDLNLLNGKFHLYWSVNHGELRQIGHAVADSPLGPYKEPVTEVPFDGRIDPQAYVDDKGGLFFYTVKFSFGNVIWGQRMRDPWTLVDAPVPLLSAVPGTWELRDHPVNEAPFVFHYRGRHYMFYNANHTSSRYGNYAIGAAESDTPLGFTNAGKYPFPLLEGNREKRVRGGRGEAPQSAVDATAAAEPSGEPLITNCGQPTVVRGPNGFERWLVYFAIYEGNPRRAQAIDRVHFFDREVFVDGPTFARTPGYHPPPALPTFRDFFDAGETLSEHWTVENGDWRIIGGQAHHTSGNGAGVARCAGSGGRFYLFEAALRIPEDGGQQAGLATSDTFIGLDREDRTWFAQPRFRYNPKENRRKLAPYFDWDGWHMLRIECNGYSYRVWLDEVALEAVPAAGYITDVRPALFARGRAAFDNVTYTLGWDGAEDPIFDWGSAANGATASGAWSSCERGIRGVPEDGEARTFKGDLLDAFEWSAQVIPEAAPTESDAAPEMGVYGVYVDEANYLRIAARANFAELRVSGKRDGAPLTLEPVSVPKRAMRYRTPEENGYNLRIVKLPRRVIVFVEGSEVLSCPGPWPPAQVGLFTRGAPCRFVGISLYDRSRTADDVS